MIVRRILLAVVNLLFFFFFTEGYCGAITVEEFNGLTQEEKTTVLNDAVQSYLAKTSNISLKYKSNRFRCSLDHFHISNRERDFSQDEFDFRRIDESYWFHRIWWSMDSKKNDQIRPTIEAFEHFNGRDGVLRTYSTANHFKEDEWYAFITTDKSPAAESSFLPEYFDITSRCDSWTSLKHLLEYKDTWKFVDSTYDSLIQVELTDFHCASPEQTSGKRTMWFDPERGFLLVRQLRDLKIVKVNWWSLLEVTDVMQIEEIWLPKTILYFSRSASSESKGSGVEIEVTDASIGSVKKKDLLVDFPRGTKVFDKIKGIEYFEGDPIPGEPSRRAVTTRYVLIIVGVAIIAYAILRRRFENKTGNNA